jgi:hypothetical protein
LFQCMIASNLHICIFHYLARRGCSGGIAGKPALPSFQKLLRLFVIDALGNAVILL